MEPHESSDGGAGGGALLAGGLKALKRVLFLPAAPAAATPPDVSPAVALSASPPAAELVVPAGDGPLSLSGWMTPSKETRNL